MTESQHYTLVLLDLDTALEYAKREYQDAYYTAEEYPHKHSYKTQADNLWFAYQNLIRHAQELVKNTSFVEFIDAQLMPNIAKIQKEVK